VSLPRGGTYAKAVQTCVQGATSYGGDTTNFPDMNGPAYTLELEPQFVPNVMTVTVMGMPTSPSFQPALFISRSCNLNQFSSDIVSARTAFQMMV
jgi:hypothetical protein